MTLWYAVHTRPRAEERALANLLRQAYRAYLPRCRTRVIHARRQETVLRPLFPRYLFVGVDRDSMRWRPILSTFGVSGLVCAGSEPIPLSAEVMFTLRERERAGAFDQLAVQRALRLGELVRISGGPFEDLIGPLIELREQDRAVVLLDFLGRAVRAEIAATAIEAA